MEESKEIRRFSEELRKRIVEEIESGSISISEASRRYGVTKAGIKYWLDEYGQFRRKRIVEVVMSDEKAKIEELQKALAEAHMKLRIYDKMIELAGKEYKVDIKKTFGSDVYSPSKKKAVESK